jgi:predicted DNA-binding protein (MmcQ/YjbR family)
LILSYSVGAERYTELVERSGLVPAPYMARIHWVAAENWKVFTDAEWKRELHAAHEITLVKLPRKVRETLALPAAEQRRLIAARRKLLDARLKKAK